jgi:organic hydroperoxide reductase OsmC/OhrA
MSAAQDGSIERTPLTIKGRGVVIYTHGITEAMRPGIDADTAQRLVEVACPYSKALHGNIDIETNLIDTAAATPVA